MDEYISKQKAKDLMGCCLASAKANYKAETSVFKKEQFKHYAETIEAMIDVVGAVEAADVQPVDRWISVKDRLPDEGERVLIYAPKTQNKYYVATFYTLRDEIKFAMNIYGLNYCWYANDVTHWMPLPEPPKDGEQNENN